MGHPQGPPERLADTAKPVLPISALMLNLRPLFVPDREDRHCPNWVTGGHAEQVAAAAGSPQKAALLAAGRDFGLGPALALFGRRPHERVESTSCRRPKTCTIPDTRRIQPI